MKHKINLSIIFLILAFGQCWISLLLIGHYFETKLNLTFLLYNLCVFILCIIFDIYVDLMKK